MKPLTSWIVAGILTAIVLALTTLFLTAEGTFQLVVGWIAFLDRTLPRVTMDWASTGVGCVALVLLAGSAHVVCRSYVPEGRIWKPRWSITCVALVVLTFAAGIATVGAVHQVGWLATAPEPLLVPTAKLHGSSASHLREIGLEFANSLSMSPNREERPPRGGTFAEDGTMLHGWVTQLGGGRMVAGYWLTRRKIDMTRPWNDPVNQDNFKDVIPELLNPELRGAPIKDANGYALSHYAANSRVMAGNYAATYAEMGAHRSSTILVGEVNANFKPWGHPTNWRDPARGINRSPDGFGGVPGSGGAHFLMADWSVRFLSERTSLEVLRALSSPRAEDKEDVGEAVQH